MTKSMKDLGIANGKAPVAELLHQAMFWETLRAYYWAQRGNKDMAVEAEAAATEYARMLYK